MARTHMGRALRAPGARREPRAFRTRERLHGLWGRAGQGEGGTEAYRRGRSARNRRPAVRAAKRRVNVPGRTDRALRPATDRLERSLALAGGGRSRTACDRVI